MAFPNSSTISALSTRTCGGFHPKYRPSPESPRGTCVWWELEAIAYAWPRGQSPRMAPHVSKVRLLSGEEDKRRFESLFSLI